MIINSLEMHDTAALYVLLDYKQFDLNGSFA